MTGSEVRQLFLKYFESKAHKILPGSSLIPAGDPTLLFTNAGMVQFKKIFTGEEKRDIKRAATVQKCMRAGGKHNDFENVGKTMRHHTFFEMLGNFSFGDYFKEEAIEFAWELVIDKFQLDRERIWITIFKDDDEAYNLWRKIGIPAGRIVRMDEKDNFWSMGETGPCGPCSEIIYDQGAEIGCGRPDCGVGCDCDRFLEIWNLVFMQFERLESGKLNTLPRPSIDTGMGLERITAVIQGVKSNYDTDIFQGIIDDTQRLSGVEYGKNVAYDVAFKVIADHIRAIVFLIADGVVPSNDGRGYVLRRIIRRASRYGKKLGIEPPFLVKLVQSVESSLGDQYTEIRSRSKIIESLLMAEEEKFAETLEKGLHLFNEEIKKLSGRELPGELVFRLYDTFGFPVDITEDLAREAGFTFDRKGFEAALEEQRMRSREGMKQGVGGIGSVYSEIIATGFEVYFCGYEMTEANGKVVYLIKDGVFVDEAGVGEEIEIITDRTPFYGESGGQVGDTGIIFSPERNLEIDVIDTKKPAVNLVVHRCRVRKGRVKRNMEILLSVDPRRRSAIAANHTATHLLHAALRQLIGEHVKQSGSLVASKRFRFDFTHYSSLSEKELLEIEDLVNSKVRENIPVETEIMPYNSALSTGALAFFDEKYGETVRLVKIDNFSKELCGGTHTKSTGEIGLFKIVSEEGISAGVRRIEALTGLGVLEYLRNLQNYIKDISAELKVPADGLLDRIRKMTETIRILEKEKEELKRRLLSNGTVLKKEWKREAKGNKVIVQWLDNIDEKSMLQISDRLKNENRPCLIFLMSENEGRISLIASISNELTDKFDASKWMKHVASVLGGKGGGKRESARGSGIWGDKIESAVAEAFRWVEELSAT